MKEREKLRSLNRDILFNHASQTEKILFEIVKQNDEVITLTSESAFLTKYSVFI